MTSNPSVKRLSLAITAAVASMTLAIGVSAASLLGWFAPAAPTAASPSDPPPPPPPTDPASAPTIIYVPIAPIEGPVVRTPVPAEPALAMDKPRRHEHEDEEDDD